MVQRTGMDPEPFDPHPPSEHLRMRHQPTAMPLASQFGDEREKRKLAIRQRSEIQLQYADFNAHRVRHRVNLNVILVHDVDQRPFRHDEAGNPQLRFTDRSVEHKSELQSLMRTSYAVFCFTKIIKLIITYTAIIS